MAHFKKNTKYNKYITNDEIYDIYYNEPIDNDLIVFSSRDGKDFTGNIFCIFLELNKPEYHNFKKCIYVNQESKQIVLNLSTTYGYNVDNLIFADNETDAIKYMEKAKYIISDSGVPWKYVKRKGQVVVNTWHGTPLKVMGKYIPTEKHKIGTTQHFLLSSDYLLYPSYYMKDKMLQSYMVDKIASGKAIISGYPRNSVFFDNEKRSQLKKKLNFDDKKVYAYMPTHRGNSENNKNGAQLQDVIDYMSELDLYLQEDEIVLLKLHVLNQSQIDFEQFNHIFPFPPHYETYDILNCCDILITDYSSVLFDYANTGNKIIIFNYDENEYFQDRGTYFPLSELPFPRVATVKELLVELHSEISYDQSDFINKFCSFDSISATADFCHHVFLDEKKCIEEIIKNNKQNILIFGGSLEKNGITTALYNLLNSINDNKKYNFFLSFRRDEANKNPEKLEMIPAHVDFLPLMCDQIYTSNEREAYDHYVSSSRWDEVYPETLHKLFKREWDRYYWGTDFKKVIQFDGYGKNVNMLFLEHPGEKTVFVHNDMWNEINVRHIQHRATLRMIYNNFDYVAVVSPELIPTTEAISLRSENIITVNNIHNYEEIITKANEPIEFQKNTVLQPNNPYGLYPFLNGDGYKFVTVGRFSKEKGHMRLLDAFEKFCDIYPDSKLMIIGGHGNLYQDTVTYAKTKKCQQNIYLLKSIENPMPIVKQCDLFILSSYYEGMPMTIKEADTLGIPIIATDIPGVHDFMFRYNGTLVTNNTEGILDGMFRFTKGEVSTLDICYRTYNEQALTEFKRIIG